MNRRVLVDEAAVRQEGHAALLGEGEHLLLAVRRRRDAHPLTGLRQVQLHLVSAEPLPQSVDLLVGGRKGEFLVLVLEAADDLPVSFLERYAQTFSDEFALVVTAENEQSIWVSLMYLQR